MKNAVALVDYDNVKREFEDKISDVSINLSIMIPNLTHKIGSMVPEVEEIRFRLYGGWSYRDGQSTIQCAWLLSEISKFSRRYGKIRANCSLARELIARSDLELVGTYRDKGQKMVDGMLTSDLIYLSNKRDSSVVVVSDDDDFVPGVITSSCARSKKDPIIVLRPARKSNTPLNDHLYERCHVDLSQI